MIHDFFAQGIAAAMKDELEKLGFIPALLGAAGAGLLAHKGMPQLKELAARSVKGYGAQKALQGVGDHLNTIPGGSVIGAGLEEVGAIPHIQGIGSHVAGNVARDAVGKLGIPVAAAGGGLLAHMLAGGRSQDQQPQYYDPSMYNYASEGQTKTALDPVTVLSARGKRMIKNVMSNKEPMSPALEGLYDRGMARGKAAQRARFEAERPAILERARREGAERMKPFNERIERLQADIHARRQEYQARQILRKKASISPMDRLKDDRRSRTSLDRRFNQDGSGLARMARHTSRGHSFDRSQQAQAHVDATKPDAPKGKHSLGGDRFETFLPHTTETGEQFLQNANGPREEGQTIMGLEDFREVTGSERTPGQKLAFALRNSIPIKGNVAGHVGSKPKMAGVPKVAGMVGRLASTVGHGLRGALMHGVAGAAGGGAGAAAGAALAGGGVAGASRAGGTGAALGGMTGALVGGFRGARHGWHSGGQQQMAGGWGAGMDNPDANTMRGGPQNAMVNPSAGQMRGMQEMGGGLGGTAGMLGTAAGGALGHAVGHRLGGGVGGAVLGHVGESVGNAIGRRMSRPAAPAAPAAPVVQPTVQPRAV